jgi:prepilin-type processing-associated H-X9-DG protein
MQEIGIDGGCSSVWLERRVVAPKVAGSSPVIHPNTLMSLGSIFNFLFCDGQ